MKPEGAKRLELVPITRDEANEFVRRFHRHRGRVPGARFSIAAAAEGEIVGVAMIGRPLSRHLDDGWTAEVIRLCSDGTPNASSFLYAAAWRAARALGFRRLITYTLEREPGTSLLAAGWKIVGRTRAESWDRPGRPRVAGPLEHKQLWEAG